MGLDIRHQVLRVALSVKVNGKRRRLSLHRARPPRTCVKLSMKITVTTSRVGAYPHTQKSGLRRLTGAYPHTKISVAQSYPDPYVFGIQGWVATDRSDYSTVPGKGVGLNYPLIQT